MTGSEIVSAIGVARAVAKAASALEGDADEKAQLSKIAENSKALEVAANAKADRVAIRQLVLTKLWDPLARWVGYKSAYFESGQFAEDLSEKLIDVPEENIVTPSLAVAAQSMEGLSYSIDEPNLKEMYLNLLVTASDSRRRSTAHPSFPQMIKQLSPEEADLLLMVLKATDLPAVQIQAASKSGGYRIVAKHVIYHQNSQTGVPIEIPQWEMYVDNWIRLGLIVADYELLRIGDDAYSWVEARPEFARLQKFLLRNGEERTVKYQEGLLIRTGLGAAFSRAVRPDTSPSGPSRTSGSLGRPTISEDGGVPLRSLPPPDKGTAPTARPVLPAAPRDRDSRDLRRPGGLQPHPASRAPDKGAVIDIAQHVRHENPLPSASWRCYVPEHAHASAHTQLVSDPTRCSVGGR